MKEAENKAAKRRGEQKQARNHRSQFNIPVVGITGSVGKSTTKEMLAAILQRKWRIIKTVNNLNLSRYLVKHIQRLNASHQAAVFEMGMNRFGEIKTQCFMAKPTIGVITKIGEAHVGNLKSKIANVVKAKQELIDGLAPKGLLILNLDDPYTKKFNLKGFKGKIQYYSLVKKTNFYATGIKTSARGINFNLHYADQKYNISLPTFGRHNVANALAAAAVAHNLGFLPQQIKQGLAQFRAPKWRLQITPGPKGALLINDSYNANPTSMRAGIDVLKDLAAKRKSAAVLGDMAELGQQSKPGHRIVGKYLAENNIDYLFTVGRQAISIAQAAKQAGMAAERIYSFADRPSALPVLRQKIAKDWVVLFKASRQMALEKLVQQLKVNKGQQNKK